MSQILRFPSCFEDHEQRYIVDEAKKMGLEGKCIGKMNDKHVSITRHLTFTEVIHHSVRLLLGISFSIKVDL